MDSVTVIIPTSAIKSHPDTTIIDETIASIRHHLPSSDVIITFDGLHPDFEKYELAYEAYRTEMLWRCQHEYKNVIPVMFHDHVHQSGMMKAVMDSIRTPLILYVEHDTPLVTDRQIDWAQCIRFILDGSAYTIRFHFEEVIPEDHEKLILQEVRADNFLPTIQWSQRPHLSTKLYYHDILSHFPDGKPTFIEDIFHGVVMDDYHQNGILGWYKHRLWIYQPSDRIGMKRSYTTDGRDGDHKVGEGF